VTAATLLIGALRRKDRKIAVAVAAGAAAAVVLWLPWLPSFVVQARTTAAPWAVRPLISDLIADPTTALGGTLGAVVVPVAVFAAWWTRRRRPLAESSTAGVLVVVGVATCLVGWIAAQVEPSWAVRYLAVAVAPFVLATAVALVPTRLGRVTIVALCSVLAGWSVIGSLLPNPNPGDAKSNVRAIARAVARQLVPGDVVVVTQTEQVPVLAHYLPPGLIYVTPTGVVDQPGVVDWRDIIHRLQVARPCTAVAPWIDVLPVGAHVLEVDPVRQLGAAGSTWSRVVNAQVAAVDKMIAGDPGLDPIGSYAQAVRPRPYAPVVAELFRKTTGRDPCG
jgi:mannosyltransferase